MHDHHVMALGAAAWAGGTVIALLFGLWPVALIGVLGTTYCVIWTFRYLDHLKQLRENAKREHPSGSE